MDIFLQQILNGLVLGSIYALIALGYTMVYGIMGLINFAHGEVVMFGAMVTISIIGMLTSMGLSSRDSKRVWRSPAPRVTLGSGFH